MRKYLRRDDRKVRWFYIVGFINVKKRGFNFEVQRLVKFWY